MKIRATLKLRNDAMIAARETRGWSQKKLSEESGVDFLRVIAIEKLDFTHPNVVNDAEIIATTIGVDKDEILSEGSVGKMIENQHIRVVEPEMVHLLINSPSRILPAPDEDASMSEMKEVVTKSLDQLSYREREILKLRFGLGENEGMTYTLEECARIFRVTRERIRGVESAALRKLHKIGIGSTLERLRNEL